MVALPVSAIIGLLAFGLYLGNLGDYFTFSFPLNLPSSPLHTCATSTHLEEARFDWQGQNHTHLGCVKDTIKLRCGLCYLKKPIIAIVAQ